MANGNLVAGAALIGMASIITNFLPNPHTAYTNDDNRLALLKKDALHGGVLCVMIIGVVALIAWQEGADVGLIMLGASVILLAMISEYIYVIQEIS